MAQDLTVNIKTTSDVPQAMDRAKAATTSFSNQVSDIGKKFSMAFKDIFLNFLGPMALLGIAINFVSKMIDENRKKQEEANQAAIDGTNKLISAEDRYWATKRNNIKKEKETVEQAKTSREETTLGFLLNDPRGKAIYVRENLKYLQGARTDGAISLPYYKVKENKRIQDEIQAIIAEDMKNSPIELANSNNKTNSTSFQSPVGVNAVVGVGNNAAMQAMLDQLEEQRKQTYLLERIAASGGDMPQDFTKKSMAAPSRSYLLTK